MRGGSGGGGVSLAPGQRRPTAVCYPQSQGRKRIAPSLYGHWGAHQNVSFLVRWAGWCNWVQFSPLLTSFGFTVDVWEQLLQDSKGLSSWGKPRRKLVWLRLLASVALSKGLTWHSSLTSATTCPQIFFSHCFHFWLAGDLSTPIYLSLITIATTQPS